MELEKKLLFQLLVKEAGIIFTTPYFQLLAGQKVKKIKRKTVTKEEFERILNKSEKYIEVKNTLFVARDENGNYLNSFYQS